MALNFQLQLVDGITPGARSARRSLEQMDAQLRLVDRDLDQSARKRARSQAQQLQGDRVSTAQYRRNAAERVGTARKSASELEALEQRVTRTQEREARRRESIARREASQARSTALRARREREELSDFRQARGRSEREAASGRRGAVLRGVGGVALAGAGAVFHAVEQIGEENRQRLETLDQLELAVARIDTGDRTGGAQRDIFAAARRAASGSNLDAGDIAGGLNRAQERFSALDDAHRADYLNTVFPELTRVAVATNSQLSDVVDTAGELQRQLNVAPTALPDTLAQMIVLGRQGSIGFADMSRHLGELAGMTSRFMRTTGADSAHANALTGTLFQFAGRAGGSGDEAATRARGFLSNLTSARGQRRLNSLFGQNVFDRTGQLRTGEGQSQDDAFIRMIESAYARTGGNSERFLTAVAGTDEQGRALADQLRRDLATHGGHLTDFRALDAGAADATAANTQGQMFDRVMNTRAAQEQRERNQRTFGVRDNALGRGADATREMEAELNRQGLGGQIVSRLIHDVPGARTVMDIGNSLMDATGAGAAPPMLGGAGVPEMLRGTRAQYLWQMARGQATEQHYAGATGWLAQHFNPADFNEERITQRTLEIFAQLTARERAAGRDPGASINLAPDSLNGMRTAVREGVVEAMHGAAPGSGAGGTAPAGAGGSWFGGGE